MISNNFNIERFMNKYILPCVLSSALIVSSCSTSTKMTIQGAAGTEIYAANGDNIGTIPVSGQLKIKFPDETYNAFFLSQKPGESLRIPFALNYKNKGHAGAGFAEYTGYALMGAGLFSLAIGGIISIADDEDPTGGTFLFSGLGLSGLGAAIGAPAGCRREQDSYKYNYQYLPYQRINDDIVFTKPEIVYETPKKSQDVEQTKIRPARAKSTNTTQGKNGTQKAKRNIGVNTKKIQGSYVGSGKIKQGNETVETLKGVTIQIKRINDSTVAVDIIEVDGNNFFGASTKYTATKHENGGMILKHQTIPEAIISIDKDGIIKYMNPSLEVDGTIYTLSITGEKQ